MSIKTAIKEHFENSSLNEHFGNSSIKDHWGDHWNYLVHNKMENGDSKQFFIDNGINIRRFIAEDLDKCSELFKEVFSSYPWYDGWVSSDQARNYLNELVENPVSKGFVAFEGTDIVAACFGHKRSWWLGNEFFVDEFFVDNEKQGNGIGTQLLEFISDDLSNQGFSRLTLLTNKEIPAESFYLKNGFNNNPERTVMIKQLK